MNLEEGDYNIEIAKDYAPSPKSGDTGYTGMVALEDGTLVMVSYGHWHEEESTKWKNVPRGVHLDLVLIKQAKYKLGQIENHHGMIQRKELENAILKAEEKVKEKELYTPESLQALESVLEKARKINTDTESQQVEVDKVIVELSEKVSELVEENLFPAVNLIDEKSQVKVSAQDGVLLKGVGIIVNNIENQTGKDGIIFDISLVKDTEKVQPKDNQGVIVTIPVDKNRIVEDVYYVENQQSIEKQNILDYTPGDEVVRFEATHFSEYMVVYAPKVSQNNKPNQNDKPQVNHQNTDNTVKIIQPQQN